MAKGTWGAFSLRRSRILFGFLLLMTAMTVSAPEANAQTAEGTVRIVRALSSVPAEEGPFAVFIVLEGLEHYGTLLYDDNRDTVADREEGSEGLGAFEFTIEYDQTVLAVDEVEEGPGLNETGRTFQCLGPEEEPGSVSFGCISSGPEPPGPQGTLTLASVTLRPVGPGSSLLVLEAGLAGPMGDDAPVDVVGGAVLVTGRPVATVTPTGPSGVSTPAPTPGAGGSAATPSAGDSTVAPTRPTAVEGDQTQQSPAATAPGESGSPEAPTAPASGDGEDPGRPRVQGQNQEADDGISAGGGRPGRSVALWAAAALASLAVAGALGVTALGWQRRKHRRGG